MFHGQAGLSVALAVMLMPVARGASAGETEPPLAPSPEPAATAVQPSAVQPAAFVPPSAAPRSGGLPLVAAGSETPGDTTGAGARGQSRQPLPDWRVLAAVAAAFAVLAAVRARGSRGRTRLPTDVFEVLGEASLGGGHGVRVVRFGPKTLLVGVSSAGARTLAEIGDPQSTDCIVAVCRGSRAAVRSVSRSAAPDRARGAPAAAPPGEAA